jgi:glycerol-3-phosphate dehydrogenase
MIKSDHMKDRVSIIIIGAGIVGTSIARQLARHTDSLLLLEQGRDVSLGSTGANSGIIHGGYSARHGTKKGDFSITGNRMYPQLAEQLGFPYKRIGSLVLAFSEEDEKKLEWLLENGRANGVRELEILTPRQVRDREPRVSEHITSALWCGETGISSPYEAAIAFAENAKANGVDLRLNCEVTEIRTLSDGFKVICGSREFTCDAVVNAAGLFSDEVAAMAGVGTFTIIPRKGDYLLLSRGSAAGVGSVIFQTPTEKGKGILVTPTTWNNLMLGPDAQEIENTTGYSASFESLKAVLDQARLSVPDINAAKIIRYFTGIRPTPDTHDFIIGESDVPGFFQAAGIESPGLTSAPAIAAHLAGELVDKGYIPKRKRSFHPYRSAITLPGELRRPAEIKDDLNRPVGDPQRIVCRCEQVKEPVIIDALERNIPIDSLDAIKRRTRAGMGACQGRFCRPRVTQLIVEHTNLSEDSIEMPVDKDAQLLAKLRKLS